MTSAQPDQRRIPRAGGPAQHAGNRYHYLYAARRALELLDPGADVVALYLERTGEALADEDAVDLSVERREVTELIQVRWSGDPARRPAKPSEWWSIVKELHRIAQELPSKRGSVELKLRSNRPVSPELRAQWSRIQQWRDLDDAAFQVRLQSVDRKDVQLREHLETVVGPGDPAALRSLLLALRLETSLGEHEIQEEQRRIRGGLRELNLPDQSSADTLIQRVAECCSSVSGRRITPDLLLEWLNLKGIQLRHDVPLPAGYVSAPTSVDEVGRKVQDLSGSGGVVVVVGPPGCGKTTQLSVWASDKGYPFYACRLPGREDEIRLRADQEQFVRDLRALISDRYPGRLADNPARAPGGGQTGLARELRSVLDALAAGSVGEEPATLVIDGIDDVRRANLAADFLSILTKPPPGVVLVVSAQGTQFFPEWLATEGPDIAHVEISGLSEEDIQSIADALLPPEEEPAEVQSAGLPRVSTRGDVIERVARLSSGNPFLLRTLCERIRQEPAQDWRLVLDWLGGKPFDGVEDFFDRLLTKVPPAELAWLRVLATSREGLTTDEVATAADVSVNELAAALHSIGFVLESKGDQGALRHRLSNPALVRWVDKRPAVTSEMQQSIHSRLADIAADKPGSPLARDRVYHLYHAGRWTEVLQTVDFTHFDAVMEAFMPASRLLEDADFLADAARRSRDLTEAVRAALLLGKITHRLDVLQNSDPAGLYRVLLGTGHLSEVEAFLEELGDPSSRVGTALELAEWAFRSRLRPTGEALAKVARSVGRLHRPHRDVGGYVTQLACDVWSGEQLRALVDEAASSAWVAIDPFQGHESELSDEAQMAARCDSLRGLGQAVATAGRRSELVGLLDSLSEPFQLALRLGLAEADSPEKEDAQVAVSMGLAGHAWSEETRHDLAFVALHILRAPEAAIQLADLELPLPSPPSLLARVAPEEGLTPDKYLRLLKLRLLAGTPADVPELDGWGDKDRRQADAMYYAAAIPLIRAEVAHESRGTTEEALAYLAEARRSWAVERPPGMYLSPFFDARRVLGDMAPRLVRLAFSLGEAEGKESADKLFGLSGMRLGALTLETKAKTLAQLTDLPVARGWVSDQLPCMVEQVRGWVRQTSERVTLLIGLSEVAWKLGMSAQAGELAREAVHATKGLPYVDEETRYYGVLELLEEMHSRGVDISEHLKRVGRLIQQSHDATSRQYAGHTWEWLLRVAAVAQTPLAFELALALEDDLDDAVPCARDSVLEILRAKDVPLPLPDWVALAWAVGVENAETARELTGNALQRLVAAVASDEDAQRWRNWAAGALAVNLDPVQAAKVRAAICVGKPLPQPDGDAPTDAQAYATLEQVADVPGICARASQWDAMTISSVLDRVSEWLDREPEDRPSTRPSAERRRRADEERRQTRVHLELAVRRLLPKLVSSCKDADLERLSEVYRRLAGYWRAPEIDAYVAQRLADRDPDRSRELALSAVRELSWFYPEQMALALATLGQVGAQSAGDYLVERIAGSGIEPYWFARTLRCMPRSLVADESVARIFEGYCQDIEDSLTVVRPDPVRREVLQEGTVPPSRTTEEFLRDLLHRRDLVLRKRAREGLGILAHVRRHEVATALAQWNDLASRPAYERLTGEEGRLSALWAMAEMEPGAAVPAAASVHERYVAPNGPCSGHFTLHELGRRVCLCTLRAKPDLFSKEIIEAAQQGPAPKRLKVWTDNRGGGKASPILDRDLEYEVETLAELFGLPARHVQRVAWELVDRLHRLTEEERSRDRHLMDWAYRPSPRSLRTAHSDLFRHALRVLQQRWYERRPADRQQWSERTPAWFDYRAFDPWLPALFVNHCWYPDIYDAELEGSLPDRVWLRQSVEDLPRYLSRDGWVLVAESVESQVDGRQVYSHVESCLADDPVARGLLRRRPENVSVPDRDLPYDAYVFETDADLDWWWGQWTYGESPEPGSRILAAYAKRGLTTDEGSCWYVVRPLPVLAPSCALKRAKRGLEFMIPEETETIWRVEWLPKGAWRAWARADWLVSRLRSLSLSLFVRRWVERMVLGPSEPGFKARLPIMVADLCSSALMNQEGAWTERAPSRAKVRRVRSG